MMKLKMQSAKRPVKSQISDLVILRDPVVSEREPALVCYSTFGLTGSRNCILANARTLSGQKYNVKLKAFSPACRRNS